uniref:DUF4211 domain-containing protein n=1 Tax=Panagrellus redivivus TaxID=6233 RepID=A0A7E4V6R6_PANRE
MEDSDWNAEYFPNESQSDSNFDEGLIDAPIDQDEDFIVDTDEVAEDGAEASDVDAKPRRSTRQAVPKAPSTHEFTGSPELEDDADDWKPPEKKKRRRAPISSATRRRRNAARRRNEPSTTTGTGLKRGRPRRRPLTPIHTEGEFDVFDEDKTPSPPPPPPPPPRKARKPARKRASSPAQTSTSPVISAASLRPRKAAAPKMKVYDSSGSEKDPQPSFDMASTSRGVEFYPGMPSGIAFDPSELFGDDPAALERFKIPIFSGNYGSPENAYDDGDSTELNQSDIDMKSDDEFDEVSPTARFAKRPSDSPEDDEDYEPSDDDSELQLSYMKAMEGGIDDDDEDARKFYEGLGLSDDMDAEVAAITGGKLLPSPMDEVVKTEEQMDDVEVKSERPDSEASDYTNVEITFRKLNIGGETVPVPDLMLENEEIFKGVLSMDTFNSLSEESKAHLKRFLPRGVNPEQGVSDALTPDSGFFFGSPLELARKRINEGFYDHDYPQHQAMLRDDRRVRYDHFIRQYHMKLLKKLLLTRHAILEQAATIPPDAPIKIKPMKYANLKTLRKEKEIKERSSIRANMLMNSMIGPPSPSSASESADEQPYEPPIQQQSEGRSVHYSNAYGEHDLDTYQPHKVRSIKEMLQDYKKLKLKNPLCPSLDTSDITLEKVYERSGLSFQSERNFAQNPYPAPTTTAIKRRRKRKVPLESEGDSAPGSPTPSEAHG